MVSGTEWMLAFPSAPRARRNAEAGERVSYIPRGSAKRIGLQLDYDWWLLDDERLIIMRYTAGGDSQQRTHYGAGHPCPAPRERRDLAVRNAIPAEEYAAA